LRIVLDAEDIKEDTVLKEKLLGKISSEQR